MNIKNEQGMAFAIVFSLIVVFSGLIVVFLPLLTNQTRMSSYNLNWITARYAAEAAAKIAINEVQKSVVKDGKIPKDKTVTSQQISSASSAKAGYTYALSSDSSKIEIRATGTYNGITAQARVDYYLSESPVKIESKGVVDYISTGTYSHTDHNPKSGRDKEARWTVTPGDDKNPDCANGRDVSQVLFNNHAVGDTIDVTYRASAARKGSVSGGGYGIYYGAIGNADDMNAYVLQYDPGARYDKSKKYSSKEYKASMGTLLVKKVIFEDNVYAGDNMKNKFEYKVNSPGLKEKNCWGHDSGGTEDYYALPFQEALAGEVLRVPLAKSDDSVGSLQAIMEKYTGKPFDINEPHSFRIKTELKDGKLWHLIYCDDNPTPILQFYDHSTGDAGKYKLDGQEGRTFKGTRTGLRIWNDDVKTNFSNVIYESGGELISQSIVWL